MRQHRSRTAAVNVADAKAFVDSMEAVEGFRRLPANWAGEGTRAPSAPAIATAARLLRDRQSMAGRLTVAAGGSGDLRIHFKLGEHGDGPDGHIHIDRTGKAAILAGDMRDELGAERYASTSSKAFRKDLDALISPRTGRYGIKRVEVDGMMFDSADEGKRFRILKSEEAMGRITDLRMQVEYPFVENGRHCFLYRSDFNYVDTATGQEVIEDVKGVKTDVYKLKKKLIEARYGIQISEWPVTKKEAARRAAEDERARLRAEKEERKRQRAELAEQRRMEKELRAAARTKRSGDADGARAVASSGGKEA